MTLSHDFSVYNVKLRCVQSFGDFIGRHRATLTSDNASSKCSEWLNACVKIQELLDIARWNRWNSKRSLRRRRSLHQLSSLVIVSSRPVCVLRQLNAYESLRSVHKHAGVLRLTGYCCCRHIQGIDGLASLWRLTLQQSAHSYLFKPRYFVCENES